MSRRMNPTLQGAEWLRQHWERARLLAIEKGKEGSILVVDEIQKVPGWAESLKRLWDEDSRAKRPIRLGSPARRAWAHGEFGRPLRDHSRPTLVLC